MARFAWAPCAVIDGGTVEGSMPSAPLEPVKPQPQVWQVLSACASQPCRADSVLQSIEKGGFDHVYRSAGVRYPQWHTPPAAGSTPPVFFTGNLRHHTAWSAHVEQSYGESVGRATDTETLGSESLPSDRRSSTNSSSVTPWEVTPRRGPVHHGIVGELPQDSVKEQELLCQLERSAVREAKLQEELTAALRREENLLAQLAEMHQTVQVSDKRQQQAIVDLDRCRMRMEDRPARANTTPRMLSAPALPAMAPSGLVAVSPPRVRASRGRRGSGEGQRTPSPEALVLAENLVLEMFSGSPLATSRATSRSPRVTTPVCSARQVSAAEVFSSQLPVVQGERTIGEQEAAIDTVPHPAAHSSMDKTNRIGARGMPEAYRQPGVADGAPRESHRSISASAKARPFDQTTQRSELHAEQAELASHELPALNGSMPNFPTPPTRKEASQLNALGKKLGKAGSVTAPAQNRAKPASEVLSSPSTTCSSVSSMSSTPTTRSRRKLDATRPSNCSAVPEVAEAASPGRPQETRKTRSAASTPEQRCRQEKAWRPVASTSRGWQPASPPPRCRATRTP
mmetsp:Transcript_50279/g.92924  ORF Transcript_50279/g.92924 Transcript_50279/m.92924 type:complete len:569 (+) Transcript_50279:68-1774(+)